MDESYGASEKLKSKKLLSALFSEGRSLYKYPLKLVFVPIEEEQNHKTGVSVPKRNFKKAVDRNYLKRIIREAYRKNKFLAPQHQKLAMLFIYTGKEKENFEKVNTAVQFLLKKVNREKEK